MSALPDLGRAARVEPSATPGADATQDLYRRFSGQIYGYCLHQLGSREEAEDAVQTTFMNVFRGLQSGIVPRVEGAWLFKIAHNVCLSRRRSTRRRGRVEAPNNFEVLQEIVPARERSADELIRLHDALETMPETQRRAILLREWQGLSYREVADELQISQAAVETLIFRARRALAAGLRAPREETTWRKRARYGIDASGLLAAAKGIFGAGSTAKVALTVAALTATAVATTEIANRDATPAPQQPPATQVVRMAPPHATASQTGLLPAAAVAHRAATYDLPQHEVLHPAVASVPPRSHVRPTVTHASPASATDRASHPAHAARPVPHVSSKKATHAKVAHAYGHAKQTNHAPRAQPPAASPGQHPVAPPVAPPSANAEPADPVSPPAADASHVTPPVSPGASDEAHAHHP